MSTQAVAPEWGHCLAIWDTGKVIRVPAFVFPQLKRLGLLIRGRAILSPRILSFYSDKSLDPLIDEVRKVLGPELTGPEWLVCRCRECQGKASQLEDVRMSAVRTRQIVSEIRRKRRAA